MFKANKPERTLRILSKQQDFQNVRRNQDRSVNLQAPFIELKGISDGDSNSLMAKMRYLEEQFIIQQSQPHIQQEKIA